jgi:signal transduction histidine kinase
MIARAESGQTREEMKEFDAAEIARDVGELYEPVAEENGIALKVEAATPAPVRGNRELVSQALANLVDNAIKYGQPSAAGTPAEITVSAVNAGDEVQLTVADRGPGVPEGERPRVIERFVRLEQSRSKPGSGLGLSLAAAVARLHGGELTLEDNQPGLKTVIALPRGGPVQSADDATRQAESQSRPPKSDRR